MKELIERLEKAANVSGSGLDVPWDEAEKLFREAIAALQELEADNDRAWSGVSWYQQQAAELEAELKKLKEAARKAIESMPNNDAVYRLREAVWGIYHPTD